MTENRNTKTIIGLIIAGVLSIIVALGALGYFPSSIKLPTTYINKVKSLVLLQ